MAKNSTKLVSRNKVSLGLSILKKLDEQIGDFLEGYRYPLDPNFDRNLFYFLWHRHWPKTKAAYFNQTVARLHKRKWLEVKKYGPNIRLVITKQGKKYLQEFAKKDIAIAKPKHWDGQWRLVIFDVPNSQNKKRRAFRDHLKRLGFVQIQKSVWVIPHPCTREVAVLAEACEIGQYVSLFTGIYEGEQKTLRKIFNL